MKRNDCVPFSRTNLKSLACLKKHPINGHGRIYEHIVRERAFPGERRRLSRSPKRDRIARTWCPFHSIFRNFPFFLCHTLPCRHIDRRPLHFAAPPTASRPPLQSLPRRCRVFFLDNLLHPNITFEYVDRHKNISIEIN